MKIKITREGKIRFVYNDKLIKLNSLGKATIKRASHVEPTNDNMWIVDLSPLGCKKILGPFKTRKEALDKEHLLIESKYL